MTDDMISFIKLSPIIMCIIGTLLDRTRRDEDSLEYSCKPLTTA